MSRRQTPARFANRATHYFAADQKSTNGEGEKMSLGEFKRAGHLPTLVCSFLYFDTSFMVWTLMGALGVFIAQTFHLSPEQKGLLVAIPLLGGAILRIILG